MKPIRQYWEEIYSSMYFVEVEDFSLELKEKINQKIKEYDERNK